MSWESLVVSFGANSPLLTHFNVANEIHSADSFLLFVRRFGPGVGGGLGDKRLLEIILQPGELTLHLWK